METITVQKKTFENFLSDFEQMLTDFENMVDVALELEADKRLTEIKNKKVNSFDEKAYQSFIKKAGL